MTIINVPSQYSTIQLAINASVSGDTIIVAAGIYNECITISKDNLTILGAQSNVPRNDPNRATQPESIISCPNLSFGIAVNISASNVIFNGFLIATSNTNTNSIGILTTRDTYGTHIIFNIIQNNTIGIYLNTISPISDAKNKTIVDQNLIRNNNSSGSASGNGIYSDQGLNDVDITNNVFQNQLNASILLIGPSGGSFPNTSTTEKILIDKNNFQPMTTGILVVGISNLQISNNILFKTLGSAIELGGGNINVNIIENCIQSSESSGIRMDLNLNSSL